MRMPRAGADQAGRVAVHVAADLGAVAERRQAAALEARRVVLGHRVPAVARRLLAVAGAGVDEDQAGDAIAVQQVEAQRQVAAERVTPDHGALDADRVEDRHHVADGELRAVLRRVVRVVAAAVAAHVPRDDRVVRRQRREVAAEHVRRRGVAVGQQQRRARSAAGNVVRDADTAAVDLGHGPDRGS
ncbi:MAG: hypothetical protein QM733_12835 [Ilumatobacteraceae bacterium]